MEAKDLMIGDWVLYHGKPYQILGIKEDDVSVYRCLITGPEGFDWWIKITDFQPIPITPEILEKNGFVFKESDNYLSPRYVWLGRAVVVVVFHAEPIGGVNVLTCIDTHCKGRDGVNRVHNCDIESVHKLQHALRLCGLDDLADNFKIK